MVYHVGHESLEVLHGFFFLMLFSLAVSLSQRHTERLFHCHLTFSQTGDNTLLFVSFFPLRFIGVLNTFTSYLLNIV